MTTPPTTDLVNQTKNNSIHNTASWSKELYFIVILKITGGDVVGRLDTNIVCETNTISYQLSSYILYPMSKLARSVFNQVVSDIAR